MNFGNQLIESLIVCINADIVLVPVKDNFKESEPKWNNVDKAPCKCDRAFLAYRDFQRFVKSSTYDVPKGFESVRDKAEPEGSSNDFGRILTIFSDSPNLAFEAILELALCTFKNNRLCLDEVRCLTVRALS